MAAADRIANANPNNPSPVPVALVGHTPAPFPDWVCFHDDDHPLSLVTQSLDLLSAELEGLGELARLASESGSSITGATVAHLGKSITEYARQVAVYCAELERRCGAA